MTSLRNPIGCSPHARGHGIRSQSALSPALSLSLSIYVSFSSISFLLLLLLSFFCFSLFPFFFLPFFYFLFISSSLLLSPLLTTPLWFLSLSLLLLLLLLLFLIFYVPNSRSTDEADLRSALPWQSSDGLRPASSRFRGKAWFGEIWFNPIWVIRVRLNKRFGFRASFREFSRFGV